VRGASDLASPPRSRADDEDDDEEDHEYDRGGESLSLRNSSIVLVLDL
jgi:hypothetical protein